MLHSVCDLAGLNRITNKVLHNGAMAMAGMVRYPAETPSDDKPLVLLSTLGTTETCIKIIRGQLLKAENSRIDSNDMIVRIQERTS